jgi:hypothetical protein
MSVKEKEVWVGNETRSNIYFENNHSEFCKWEEVGRIDAGRFL